MNDAAALAIDDRPFAPPAARHVTIELAGEPKGKGRPRFLRKTGIAYTPQPTRNYEAALRMAGQLAMRGDAPIEGPLRITVTAVFSVPASWSKRKTSDALAGNVRPTGRPDLDNIIKMLDAFNAVVWRDDSQIVTATVTKRYGDRPYVRIEVEGI